MAKFSIYSKDGSVIRYAGEPKYAGTFMGVSYIEFSSIDSPVPISWERGDYVDYYRIGKRFRLYSLPEPKKQARKGENGASFIYSNVKFYASTKDLEIAPFRDLVPADNNVHFSTRPDVSTYENVYGIAARIQECMDDIFPGKWAIEVFDTSDSDLLALFNEQKEFSVSNGSCLEALSQIYETWKNVGWIHTYDSARDKEIITIGRTSLRDSENTSDSYAYGIGDGLTSIKKAAANEDEFATRLYIYGSDRNIQTRYYNGLDIHDKDSVNIVNLMIPPEKWGKTDGLPDARKAYLQADDALIEKYGLIPRTVYFDGNENEEIYPSITGLTCAQVRSEMLTTGVPADSPGLPPDNSERIDMIVSAYGWTTGDKEETEAYPTFDLHLRQMGFNIAAQGKLTSEGKATISMRSGACAGREFKVKSFALDKNGQPVLSMEKSWDDSLGMSFPNELYPLVPGDQFVLLDIPMPNYVITLAQKRLLEAGENLLSDYTRVSPLYEPSVDSFKIKKGAKILQEGMYMQVYDKDIIDTEDNNDYILIDSLSIDEKGDMPTYKVTLREQKRSGRTFGTLEGMIEDAKKSTDDEIKRQRIYTDRRFRSAQETISMLQEAFDGYTEGVNPVTIETMSLLVGNEALQFKFTATRDSLSAVPCPLSYNNDTNQLSSVPASLIHLTLGIDAITTQSMPAGSYMSWDLPEWYSAQMDDPSKGYYVYAKVSTTAGGEATYLLSETAIGMSEVEGYYHLLVGIINSEYVGARDFVTVYGFTEVLPGQITVNILRDADGKLIIDLANATITAKNGATIKGAVKIEDGSLMSSRIDIGDTSTSNLIAFLNGGAIGSDATMGKLILAAGIPNESASGSTALGVRAKEADTRIYEKGYLITKFLEALGGHIGGLKVTEKGLELTDGNGTLFIDSDGFQYLNQAGKGPYMMLEGCANGNVLLRLDNSTNDLPSGYCPGDRVTLIIAADDGKDAIQCPRGTFSGFRPKTRAIQSDATLDELDHTIINISSSADVQITLPVSPLKGQEYRICNKYNTKLTIYGGASGKNIRNIWTGKFMDADGKETDTASKYFVTTNANMIDILWDGSEWLANWGH